jgi:hypothetical protein
MAAKDHLIPPKKGEIRNPKGKPKGTLNRSTLLKKWLAVNIQTASLEDKTKKITTSCFDAIEMTIIKKALAGDVQAYKEIKDTLYGKIAEITKITGDINTSVKHNKITKKEAERIKKLLDL